MNQPNAHPTEQVDRARRLARQKWGRATAYRLGLVAGKARLNFNPYPHGSRTYELFAEASGIWTATWPCGHPKTPENTAPVGSAGFRCRQCRRRIDQDSKKRRKRNALTADSQKGITAQ